jgi:hypothetical protein
MCIIMPRKKKTLDPVTGEVTTGTATAKVTQLADHKSELQKLKEENRRLKSQLHDLVCENMILRRQTNQPERGPLAPPFIVRETIEKINDPFWYYRALDTKGLPVVLEKATGKWIRLLRATYIRHYGEIPAGCNVYPIDGDNRNFDPENLIAMPKKEFFEKTGWVFDQEGNAIRESEMMDDE